MQPCYSDSILAKAKKIKLLICDVDGVLSDGKVYYSNSGEELKNFNIKDGLGIKHLLKNGIQIAIITGRESKIVKKRATELGIRLVFQNRPSKVATFNSLLNDLNIESDCVAHIGDDLPDLPLIQRSGLGVSVADGHYFVKQNADWVTQSKGGQGAVREVSDLLLHSQDKIIDLHQSYLNI